MSAGADSDDPRAAVIDLARAMDAAGLNRGAAGNVSVRAPGGGQYITPTGLGADDLALDAVPHVADDGGVTGRYRPSSEWDLHRAVYRARPDAGAVIHTHAVHCTTLACQERGIPAFHYMVALFGGRDIPCAPYATFGTPELAAAVGDALAGRDGCLMAHHGMVVCGATPIGAKERALHLENLAEVYWRALMLGPPPLISDGEMDRVLTKFQTYGQQDES